MNDVASNSGRTVLFVSHNMDSMLNLCKRGLLLDNGMVKYQGDIKSTVSEYLGSGNNEFYFTQKVSRHEIFISECCFEGATENKKGLFMFDEELKVYLKFKKHESSIIDNNLMASIYIETLGHTKITSSEICISKLQTQDELEIHLEYPSSVLMPGKYMLHIDIHTPNIRFYDRQDTCFFSIFDNGTEFLKYNGYDCGLVVLRPQFNIL